MKKPDSPKEKIIDFNVFRKIVRFIGPYKRLFYGVIGLTLLIGFLTPVLPWLIQYTVDEVIAKAQYHVLWQMGLIMLVVLMAQAALQFIQSYSSSLLGQNVIRDIRAALFKRNLKLRLKHFDQTPIGQMVTRHVSDTETLNELFSDGLAAFGGDLLSIVFIFSIMTYIDWRLTLVSLATLPILLIATYIFKEKVKSTFNDVRNQVARLNTFVQENITGMNIVQIFSAQQRQFDKFKSINLDHRKANIKTILYYSVYFPVAEIVAASSTGLIIWYGGGKVLQSQITEGTIIAFLMYLSMFFRPIRTIADRFNKIQMGIVSASRIIKLLENNDFLPENGTVDKSINGKIEVKNVTMGYQPDKPILKNISFSVNPGQSLAVVGATGSGKTTMINLLNRFYEYQSGAILIDEIPIEDYKLQSLRGQIGMVLQDVFLFSGNIYENITLGNNEISRKQVLDAAEMVGALPFIERLPGQLDFNVKERGATLSVGQRQLISIIRVMLQDPKILILDEATSSIDSETEELVHIATEKILTNRTSIIIAHRLSTIKNANNIMVLDKGEIIEIGNHYELLNQNGAYRNLIDKQLATEAI